MLPNLVINTSHLNKPELTTANRDLFKSNQSVTSNVNNNQFVDKTSQFVEFFCITVQRNLLLNTYSILNNYEAIYIYIIIFNCGFKHRFFAGFL